MFSFKNRYNTFKGWPFAKDEKCSPEKMAQAGFFKQPGYADLVKCYYCSKELDGWEPADDPFQEHRNHADYCPLIKMFKEPPEHITIGQLLKLEEARILFHVENQLRGEKEKLARLKVKNQEHYITYYEKYQ